MNHQFSPVIDNPNKCSICNRGENTHGTCECCPNEDTLVSYKTFKMCIECYDKEKSLTEQSNLRANDRVLDLNETIRQAQISDATIEINTDFFNAQTVSIADIKSAIDGDDAIPHDQKNFKLCEFLKDRFNDYKLKAFNAQQAVVESHNAMKAIQVYLNNLSNQLRAEERKQLQLQDINYTPNIIKPVKERVKSIPSPTKKKYTMAEIKKAADSVGVSQVVIQAMVISQNISPEVAANKVKTIMVEANITNARR